MKNIIYFILFFLMGSAAIVNANNRVSLLESSGNVVFSNVEIILNLGDLTSQSETEITEAIEDFIHSSLEDIASELDCSVTVKGNVSVGLAKLEISVTVSGPCSQVKKQGKQIATEILDEIKDALKK